MFVSHIPRNYLHRLQKTDGFWTACLFVCTCCVRLTLLNSKQFVYLLRDFSTVYFASSGSAWKLKMDRSRSTHEPAMARLCFVCGNLIDTTRMIYDVDTHQDMLRRTLKGDISIAQVVTPPRFCFKCFCALKNLDRGNIENVESRKIILWKKCGPSCESCVMLKSRQAGGRKEEGTLLFRWNVNKWFTLFFIRNFSCRPFWPVLYFAHFFDQKVA